MRLDIKRIRNVLRTGIIIKPHDYYTRITRFY